LFAYAVDTDREKLVRYQTLSFSFSVEEVRKEKCRQKYTTVHQVSSTMLILKKVKITSFPAALERTFPNKKYARFISINL